jgi:hypothetical protein
MTAKPHAKSGSSDRKRVPCRGAEFAKSLFLTHKLSAPLRGRLLAVAALCFLFSPLSARSDGDWQIWMGQTTGHDLDEYRTLRVDQSFRFGNDVSQLNTYSVLFGLRTHKKPWIEHGFYLRYEKNRIKDSDDLDEFRPTYDLVLKWSQGEFRWVNRSRFEYRMKDGSSNSLRYRNRQKLILPWELTPLKLKPYGAAEVFFEVDGDTLLDQTRFRGLIGVQTEPDGFIRRIRLRDGRRLTFDLYLMAQRTDDEDFSINDYIAGMKLGYFF